MSAKRTPGIAIWLVQQFGCSRDAEAVTGDLIEQYESGQSRIWLWRQVATAIVSGCMDDAFAHKTLMIRSILMGWGGLVLFKVFLLDFVSVIIHIRMLPASAFEPVIVSGQAGFVLPTPWYFSYPATFVICTMLCMAVTGRIAARVGGEHRRAAVFSYLSTLMIYVAIGIGPTVVFALQGVERMPWASLGKIALYLASILVGGLVTRSAPQPEALS
jgi:hypothetical protein